MAISSSTYILLNGNFHTQSSLIFNIDNRGFAYGDCIRETIHTCADRLCFIDQHLRHLREGMKLAMMDIPKKFLNKDKEFSAEISKLLTKNRVFRGSTVTITVFRSAFAPMSTSADGVEYTIHCEPHDELGYSLNGRGLRLGVVEGSSMAVSPFSNYYTCDNSLQKIAIAKQCLKHSLDDSFIFNADKHIVETAGNGNVFVIKGNTIQTPPLSDGCKDDVMRRVILEKVAPAMGYTAISDVPLLESDINNSDINSKIEEIFVASTHGGIQWVSAFKSRRFMRAKTTAIVSKVSELYEAQQ